MSAQFEPIEATRTSGQRSLESRVWVALTSNHNIDNRSDVSGRQSQTKVSFNEVMCKTSTSVYNHATRVGAPAPIVIEKFLPRLEEQEENMENNRTGHAEKLLPWFEEQGSMGSSRSSLRFSAISEERLSAAIRLAKLDLRRRRPGSLNSSSSKPPEDEDPRGNSNVDLFQRNPVSIRVKQRTLSPKEKTTRPVPKLLVHTHQKKPISISIGNGLSPPTRDPGSRPLARGKQPQLNQDICKIQKELGAYIQKIETLANRGPNIEEPLEPDEQLRIEVRKQRQAARSARIIYSLQRQVKEAQDAIEITCSQEVSETRKFKAMGRLVATHRAAVRAIQVFIHQLSGPSDGSMPPHLKELGQLLRQLSLCSAKVEVDQGSTIPETTLEILQKLETLDSVLSKQERPQKRQVRARSLSPLRCKSPRHSMSPPRASRGLSITGFQGPHKAAGPKKSLHGWRLASKNQRRVPARPAARGQVLRAGLQTLVQQGKLSEETNTEPEPNRKGEAPERGKVRDAGFQQPTVSSRLRVSQMPQKEHCVPWMPASPHSPPHPQGSSQRRRPEPRCLFSPLKPPESPSKQKVPKGPGAEQCTTSDRKNQAHSEALRQAWLDKMTMQRLKELNQLTKEEMERIQTLRLQVGSPTQWAERAEQKAREKIQPLLDEVQKSSSLRQRLSEQAAERAVESAEQLSEALLNDRLGDTSRAAWAAETDRRFRAPTLESMLLRMEEIQKDEEEVRRRFASITYSDHLSWSSVKATENLDYAVGSEPATPQPIRLTRSVLRHSPVAEIILEKPVETCHSVLSESSLAEESSQDEHRPGNGTMFPGPVQTSGATVVSVPGSVLRSIRHYREDYEAYLCTVAHNAVGSFNPWAVADSLAEELLSDALADVAAEFQDVCEDYSEAVFTSEFLQPVQSPPR